MMHRRTLGVLGCAAALGGTALAVAPGAASAAGTCANKTLAVKPAGGRTLHIPVKAIYAEGLSCAQADAVIALVVSGKTPKAWKSVSAHFTAPVGLVPQEVKASGRSIRYAVPGG